MTALAETPLTPKAAATYQRLLELSARLFIERGYSAVSLRDIAPSYSDPDTAYFIIDALSAGIGVAEAYARDTPGPSAFRETLSPMLLAVSKDTI